MKPVRLLAALEATSITGPAKNLLQYAASLAAEGPAAPVQLALAVFVREGQPNAFIPVAEAQGLRVFPVAERRAFDPAAIAHLRAAVEAFRPDALQTHAVKSHFLARASGLNRRLPWVAFHHGYTWPALRARLYNQLDRWSLRAPAQILTVSRPFREELIRMGAPAQRMEVVHNAIDPHWGSEHRTPEARRQLRAALGFSESDKVVLIVGRLSAEKDHQTLLRAFHAAGARAAAPIRLLIVGDGPQRPAIEQTVRELGLAAAVTLTGQAPSAAPYYGIADIAVLSSLSEGSPNALLEAMAAGVPAIATEVGGVPEIATAGATAVLVKPASVTAMANALLTLMLDEPLARRLAAAAQTEIRARFSPEARAVRLNAIYRALADA